MQRAHILLAIEVASLAWPKHNEIKGTSCLQIPLEGECSHYTFLVYVCMIDHVEFFAVALK